MLAQSSPGACARLDTDHRFTGSACLSIPRETNPMHSYSTDWLVRGVLTGVAVTVGFIVLFNFLDIPAGHQAHGLMQIAVPVLPAASVVFARPILLKTVLRVRRSPFLLDEDLNAMFTGQVVGVIGGVLIGIVLYTDIF
ncbi:hypothetical protein PQQ51_03295 [Paraburkholderia xenovorans]|uniref:hypothetical protein n=1 Tax=Paraburkholderia xenovorans TaxID=36873 RepID=UPI0038B71675